MTGGNSYAYNSWLKLASMNGGQVTLTYNGLGQLVAKTVNNVTTQYLIDDLSPTGYAQVVEEVTGGAVTRAYTYGYQRISESQPVGNLWTPSFYDLRRPGDGAPAHQLRRPVNGQLTRTTPSATC